MLLRSSKRESKKNKQLERQIYTQGLGYGLLLVHYASMLLSHI